MMQLKICVIFILVIVAYLGKVAHDEADLLEPKYEVQVWVLPCENSYFC